MKDSKPDGKVMRLIELHLFDSYMLRFGCVGGQSRCLPTSVTIVCWEGVRSHHYGWKSMLLLLPCGPLLHGRALRPVHDNHPFRKSPLHHSPGRPTAHPKGSGAPLLPFAHPCLTWLQSEDLDQKLLQESAEDDEKKKKKKEEGVQHPRLYTICPSALPRCHMVIRVKSCDAASMGSYTKPLMPARPVLLCVWWCTLLIRELCSPEKSLFYLAAHL